MPKLIDEGRVFTAVLELFVARGYSMTATKEIARSAGVNEATLFRRYGSKAELIVSAVRAHLQDVPLRHLRATDDVEADLMRIVEAYLETNSEVGAVIPLLLVEASRHPELGPALAAAWENTRVVLGIIEHHQARGALGEEPALAIMTALVGPLLVLGMFRKATPQQSTFDVDVEQHVRAFLHGRGTAHPR